jgi:hypothetical protein
MSAPESHPLASRVYHPTSTSAKTTTAKSELLADDPLVALAAERYYADPDRLHGDTVPDVTIKKEQPVHRLMIWMHAQGASVTDIAKHTDYSVQMVRTTLKQPWARQRLLQILKETGQDAVKHFLTHEVAPSLDVLRQVRDGEIPGRTSDRAAAANSILDRALGKPTVHVESDNTTRNVPADLQRLEAEIAATRQQLAERGAIGNS